MVTFGDRWRNGVRLPGAMIVFDQESVQHGTAGVRGSGYFVGGIVGTAGAGSSMWLSRRTVRGPGMWSVPGALGSPFTVGPFPEVIRPRRVPKSARSCLCGSVSTINESATLAAWQVRAV